MQIYALLCSVIYFVGCSLILMDPALGKAYILPERSFVYFIPGNNEVGGILVIGIIQIV